MSTQIEFIKVIDALLYGYAGKKQVMGFSFDVGNATCTVTTPFGIVTFPHALRMLARDEINVMLRENEFPENVYEVDGQYFELGFSASMRGDYAIRQGALRYTRYYIGVLYAILAYEAIKRMDDKKIKPIVVWANHPPMHRMFKDDIKKAIEGEWRVTNKGVTKQFHFAKVFTYHEPIAGHAYAYLGDNGKIRDKSLKSEDLQVWDLGGFSFDVTVFKQGVPQLGDANQSAPFGMTDILRHFEQSCRNDEFVEYELMGDKVQGLKQAFKYIEKSDTLRWREAFKTGYYDAGAYGILDCTRYLKQSGEFGMNEIMSFVQNEMGGLGSVNRIILSGGGMSRSAMGRYVTPTYTGALTIQAAESDVTRSNLMHLVTSLGAAKLLKAVFATKRIKSLD